MDALGDDVMQGRGVCLVDGRHQLHGWLEVERGHYPRPTLLARLDDRRLDNGGLDDRGRHEGTLGLKGCLGLGSTLSRLLTLALEVGLLALRWGHAALGCNGLVSQVLEPLLLGLVLGCLGLDAIGLGEVARLLLLGELGQQLDLNLTHAPRLVLNLGLAPLLFAAFHHITLGRGQTLVTSQSSLVNLRVVVARAEVSLLARVVDAVEHALAGQEARDHRRRAVCLAYVDSQLFAVKPRHWRVGVHRREPVATSCNEPSHGKRLEAVGSGNVALIINRPAPHLSCVHGHRVTNGRFGQQR